MAFYAEITYYTNLAAYTTMNATALDRQVHYCLMLLTVILGPRSEAAVFNAMIMIINPFTKPLVAAYRHCHLLYPSLGEK